MADDGSKSGDEGLLHSRRSSKAAFMSAALLALLAVTAPPAGAQQAGPPDTIPEGVPDSVEYEMQGLTVEATRPTLSRGGGTAVNMSMDSVEVVPSPTLDEVLRNMPLVRVRRNSRGQVQPSVRGMEERQIAVLVDGVPLTVGWDNRSDLSVIPMTAANEVDMVRGLSSVLAGPNALGGVIRIGISQGPFPDTLTSPLDVRAALDHTGSFSLSGEVDHLTDVGGGDLWIKYGGGFRDGNDYAAPSGLASRFPLGVTEDDRILNSDMQFANGFASARYQGDGGEWLSFSTAAYSTEQGVVPELHLVGSDQPAPRYWRYPNRWQSLSSLSGGTGWKETPLGRGDLEASVGFDRHHMEIDGFSGPSYADSVEGEVGNDRTVSARLLGDHTLGPGTISGSFTWAETWHEQILSSSPNDPDEYTQRLGSVGLEISEPLAPGLDGWIANPRLTVGGSYDWASTPETGDYEPRAGIDGWGFRTSAEATVADGAAKVHGGVSRKVRFPALRELYSGALGKFEPNPDLGPLTLKVGELGATLHASQRLELQGTIFQQRLEGSIARVPVGEGLLQRQNVGERRATGAELVANYRRSGLVVRGGLTLQDVEIREDVDDDGAPEVSRETRAEYQPELSGDISLTTPAVAGFRLRGQMQYIGSQFGANPRTEEYEELDPTAYLEAGLSRKIGQGFLGLPPLRVSAMAENLTDQLVWDQLGLPRPGRTFRVQVELR